MMHRDHRNYLDRVATQASNVFDLTQIPRWLERNTSNPNDKDLKWNFQDHEYQPEILSDMSDEVVAQKCSQVGASELWVRLMLGMLELSKSMTIIYVLPTKGFAQKFSKARIDPVIANSALLRSNLNKDVDSSELKQIGSNFLYIAGSYGQSSAISVPARGLFLDEVDFCNQTTLTTYNSRLGHAKPGEFYKRSFSTPTVERFGINAMYEESSKAHYCVLCRHCSDWVAPDFMKNVEVPGFDGNLFTFEKEDLENTMVNVNAAFIRCPVCDTPLEWKDILDPKLRKWVHEEPSNEKHGYQIIPIDVPAINPISRTLKQISDYERKKDWVNFKVGYPYSDAETSFLRQAMIQYAKASSLPKPDYDEDATLSLATNTVFGLDIGKVSWFTVMASVDGEARAVYFERIRQDGDNYLCKRVMFLIQVFGCVKGVVDAGPDITASKFLVENNPIGKVWACYYVKQPRGSLESYRLIEEEGVVNAVRTSRFDTMAKRINTGKTTLTKGPEFETVQTHLANMKRVDHQNDQGEMVSVWVNVGEDHYAHSLNYAHLAMDMLHAGTGFGGVVASLPGVRRRPMSSGELSQEEQLNMLDDPLRLKLAKR